MCGEERQRPGRCWSSRAAGAALRRAAGRFCAEQGPPTAVGDLDHVHKLDVGHQMPSQLIDRCGPVWPVKPRALTGPDEQRPPAPVFSRSPRRTARPRRREQHRPVGACLHNRQGERTASEVVPREGDRGSGADGEAREQGRQHPPRVGGRARRGGSQRSFVDITVAVDHPACSADSVLREANVGHACAQPTSQPDPVALDRFRHSITARQPGYNLKGIQGVGLATTVAADEQSQRLKWDDHVLDDLELGAGEVR